MLRVNVAGLEKADTGLRQFVATVTDLTPFWSELGETLATEAQARWPLKRRSGKLRRSLTWAGDRLGRGGIFQSDPDRLKFGSAVFYGRFAQLGTLQQRATPLIHIDPEQHTEQLSAWLRSRAVASGLEVTP